MPSKKKGSVSGQARAREARERFRAFKVRSEAAKRAAETRRIRAREGVYGKLEQRAQSRRDTSHLQKEHKRIRELTAEIERLKKKHEIELHEYKREKEAFRDKIRAVHRDLDQLDYYDAALFDIIARKHGFTPRELYTIWLYH